MISALNTDHSEITRSPLASTRLIRFAAERLQPLLVLICVVVLMSVIAPNFLSVNNALTIGVQGTVHAVLAIGMTLVVISGGIDLSVGTVMSLTMVVMGLATITAGL